MLTPIHAFGGASRYQRPACQGTLPASGAGQWTGPGNDLAARFGRDAPHAEWFYGFRLAVNTDLGSRIVRVWSIVPAAVSECEVAIGMLEERPAPRHLLADKGFSGRKFTARLPACGIALLVPPANSQRASRPPLLLKVIAEWRNRVEASFADITDRLELASHGTFRGGCSHIPYPPRQHVSHDLHPDQWPHQNSGLHRSRRRVHSLRQQFQDVLHRLPQQDPCQIIR